MIHVFDTPQQVAEAAAARVAWEIAAYPGSNIGLAGGSTPKVAYRLLAEAGLDWDRTTLWLGDERYVPADHEDSNARMARTTLGPDGAARLIAPDTSLGNPAATAAAYQDALDATFATSGGPGLVLLGIGDDGHTASLFPGTTALDNTTDRYVANHVTQLDTWRLTATFPLLWCARTLLFLVTGEGKTAMIERVLGNDEPFPSQRVSAGASNVIWLLDRAAAGGLKAPLSKS